VIPRYGQAHAFEVGDVGTVLFGDHHEAGRTGPHPVGAAVGRVHPDHLGGDTPAQQQPDRDEGQQPVAPDHLFAASVLSTADNESSAAGTSE
jgi:hypothetical protein